MDQRVEDRLRPGAIRREHDRARARARRRSSTSARWRQGRRRTKATRTRAVRGRWRSTRPPRPRPRADSSRAKWPISVPLGSQSASHISGRCVIGRLRIARRDQRRERIVVHQARDRDPVARGEMRRDEDGHRVRSSAGSVPDRAGRRGGHVEQRQRVLGVERVARLQNSQVTPTCPCSAMMLSTSVRPIIRSAFSTRSREQLQAKRARRGLNRRRSSSGKRSRNKRLGPARDEEVGRRRRPRDRRGAGPGRVVVDAGARQPLQQQAARALARRRDRRARCRSARTW